MERKILEGNEYIPLTMKNTASWIVDAVHCYKRAATWQETITCSFVSLRYVGKFLPEFTASRYR